MLHSEIIPGDLESNIWRNMHIRSVIYGKKKESEYSWKATEWWLNGTEWSLNGDWNVPAIQSTEWWLKGDWMAPFSFHGIVAFRLVINLFLWFCFWQMMIGLITLMMLTTVLADGNTGSCKDMSQGYLTGQLSSALGVYQVEALRREFKSFTDVIENSIKMFKEKINTDMKAFKG